MRLLTNLLTWTFLASALTVGAATEVKDRLQAPVVLSGAGDLHLTASEDVLGKDATVTLESEDAWLFFDNVKPNDVVKDYASKIMVDGKALDPETNGRISVYRQGCVVMAHQRDMQALMATGKGYEMAFQPEYYYSNAPAAYVPTALTKPLAHDNAITHISLKRGYMATLACEANGMGYSRVFVADDNDLDIDLPVELSGKVSFVRVLPWQYPSKKGWTGTVWKTMPDGLKYAFQQCDLTNSTWYYNWGLRPTTDPNAPDQKTYNQEFVPEKWGAGGDPTVMYTLPGASHLLGYNEPDHSEQSNVSVEKAIEEWPLLMQTGRRLGSPATTNFTWLYNFMSECKKRNYRVDFVVVHAYWGGKSASEWYRDLKAVHDRTKRPIWIKEWNNGANWTKESWPSGQAEQYAKQLRDLTAIVNMLDTCSFIERYSIYNWVEDKRMIIDGKGQLTPAGEFYANDQPAYFFNHDKEVVPEWHVNEAPILTYDSIADSRLYLSWTDANGEQISHYAFYRDDNLLADTLHGRGVSMAVSDLIGNGASSVLKIVSVPDIKGEKGKESNAIDVYSSPSSNTSMTVGQALVRESWRPMILSEGDIDNPVIILGTPTYRNKMPLAPMVRCVDHRHFDFGLRPWLYQQGPSFFAPDTLAYACLPEGNFQWGTIKGEAGHINKVDCQWRQVRFQHAFVEQPIVIATVGDDNDTTAVVVVRNVTKEGFEVRLRYEGRVVPVSVEARVGYMAMTPGKGMVNGCKVEVGLTPDHAVGSNLSGAYTLAFDESYQDAPHVFAQMQTENDTITSTLRQQYRSPLSTVLFKDREKSVAHEVVAPEQVGYLVIGREGDTNQIGSVRLTSHRDAFSSLSGMQFMRQPSMPGIYVKQMPEKTVKILVR